MTENKNVFGILGHPLGHTLSPQIHTRLLKYRASRLSIRFSTRPPKS